MNPSIRPSQVYVDCTLDQWKAFYKEWSESKWKVKVVGFREVKKGDMYISGMSGDTGDGRCRGFFTFRELYSSASRSVVGPRFIYTCIKD